MTSGLVIIKHKLQPISIVYFPKLEEITVRLWTRMSMQRQELNVIEALQYNNDLNIT